MKGNPQAKSNVPQTVSHESIGGVRRYLASLISAEGAVLELKVLSRKLAAIEPMR